ncbi:hypothetical protein PI93_011825 [Pandoraea fibrosis]|uniref:Glycosyl transferase family 8 n=1 Tax=Pandoraea fibrosis TaxID=1891094 RepID=A0ABX6HQU9_9BURK|nr:hypothetical protein [Pandoraea fibrosis]QHE93192.1 hypothetical protein PJ20_016175 [Pandoraea fibrosis]QHF13249.1 hypothetical protein PI93_011825 [Pandoraea fibrosis]
MTKPSQRASQLSPSNAGVSPAANAISHAWAQVGAALSPHPDCPLPTWTGGGDTLHQHLLIIGAADDARRVSQLRHLEVAAARFGKVGFIGPANMRRLVEWSIGERLVVLSRMPRDVSDWDLRCPLGTLADVLGPQAVAAHAGRPFLRVATTHSRHWRDRLAATAQHGFCVGLAGLDALDCTAEAATSSSASGFSTLAPLLRVPGVSWVPLGRPVTPRSDAIPPEIVDWIDWRTDCDDLADEASLIDNLDLVISLDAVHVHLAEGLGVPVWQLQAAAPASFRHDTRRDMRFSPERLADVSAVRHVSGGGRRADVDATTKALFAMAIEFQGWTR